MIDGDSVIFLDESQETGEAIDASSVIFLDEPAEPQQPRGLDFTLPGQQPLSTDGVSEPAIPMPEGGAELPIRPGQGLPPEPPKFISQIEQSAPSRKEAERYDYLINDALDNVGGDRGFSLNYDSIKPEHRGWFAGRLAERTREVKPVRQKGAIERGVDAVFDRGVSVGKKGISKTLEAGVELLGLDSFDRPSYEGKKFDDMTDDEKRQFMDKEFQDTLQGLYESNDPVSVWEQAGSMAGQMAPGLAAGAGLGGARQAGTWLSSLLDKGAVANAGYWGTQMFPDMYRELRKSGVSDEKAALVAAPVAFLIGFSENIGMNPANMFKGGTSGLLGRLVGYAKNVAGESFEEVIQTAMERGTTEAFKDSPDYGRVTREALEAFPQSLPAIAVLGLPGGMVRLTQDALNHPDVVKDWIHQNYEMARSIANSESTPSRSVVKDLSDAGVIKSDDFRSIAKRKHLQRQIAAGIQASSVPFRGGQVEALRQDVQPQDAPYQDLPVEQQALEPEQQQINYAEMSKEEFESQPGVLFHGTNADEFTHFDKSKFGTATDDGDLGAGVYLSTDPQVARSTKNKIAAIPVDNLNFLQLKMEDWGQDKSKTANEAIGTSELRGQKLTDALREKGFDGVKLDYTPLGYEHQEVVIFEPENIQTQAALVQQARQSWEMTSDEFSAASISPDVATEIIGKNRAGDERSKRGGRAEKERESPRMVEVDVPIGAIREQTIQYMRESTDAERVNRYAEQQIKTPITLRANQKGHIIVDDGGHRLLAAIERGDKTIPALIDVAAHKELVKYAVESGLQVPPKVLSEYPELQPKQPTQQQFPENQQFPEQENAAQQENPSPTDQAQEPQPAEPQFDGSNVPIDPNYVSARNAMVDSDRELLDRKHPMPSIDKINDAQMMAKVRQSGMVGRASDLAHDIFKNGFPDGGTTVEQETAMVLRRGELRNEYDALAEEMGKISDPVELNELVVKHNNLMERLDEIDYALRGGGTIAAQRLASRKWAYDRTDDFRPVTIVARVKANTGKPLTVEERVEANEWATKIKELEDKVKQLESKTSIDTANKVVEKNRKATERKKRKQAINGLPDAYAKAQELYEAGCLGF